MRVSCFECALRACGLFKPVTSYELALIYDVKREHLAVRAGTKIIRPDEESAELYTLYSGWAFRFKILPDDRRQILNFLLPGDLLGLQAGMFDTARHGIEALTQVELCLLPRQKIWKLFGKMPELAYDVTWLGSQEESYVDENLTSIGRRSAAERIAALIIMLYKRADVLGLVPTESFLPTLTATHRGCARPFARPHQ
jgi:CRP-like cAMP-binding protein